MERKQGSESGMLCSRFRMEHVRSYMESDMADIERWREAWSQGIAVSELADLM